MVGARPNFVKAAPIIQALDDLGISQTLLHTGQHHDASLSAVFFEELGLRQPDVQLTLPAAEASAPSATGQLAALIASLEPALRELAPKLVVLYGDVRSTLAGALVGHSLGFPIAHVEAGLRSFDLSMPEEVNRRITDILSTVRFVTSPEAIDNLVAEGVERSTIHELGNPMIDTLLANLERLDTSAARAAHELPERYAVATIHRQSNVDSGAGAANVVLALAAVARHVPALVPLHPRGREALAAAGLDRVPGVRVVAPLGYLEFISLVRGAALVVTDSGGVQEETTALDVPCLTLRPNTERPITISHGTNRLVSAEARRGRGAGCPGGSRRVSHRSPAVVGRPVGRAHRTGDRGGEPDRQRRAASSLISSW